MKKSKAQPVSKTLVLPSLLLPEIELLSNRQMCQVLNKPSEPHNTAKGENGRGIDMSHSGAQKGKFELRGMFIIWLAAPVVKI